MRVLVIRLGAFGDFVQSFAPFAAIRAHHADADITLLTTTPYAGLAAAAPWFDHVEIDRRPAWWNLPGLRDLRRQLQGFDRVYDLQTSARSSRYFRLAGRPPWSGIAAGCALPHANPARDSLHSVERQREQLEMAGITTFPAPDLAWLPRSPLILPEPFALLVPGAAPSRPRKRWPAEHYAMLARHLHDDGITPAIIGTKAEADIAALITTLCPTARDLTGRTSLGELHHLAAQAAIIIGNDTGPMHLAALAGTPMLTLFGPDSDPALTAPRGPRGEWPDVVQTDDLAGLSAEVVMERVREGRKRFFF